MATTKQLTKAQLLRELQSIEMMAYLSKEECRIVKYAEDYRDLKDILVFYANKFYSILEQIDVDSVSVQWYQGDRFYYSRSEVRNNLDAVHHIAEMMGYYVYNPNGFWFIKSH